MPRLTLRSLSHSDGESSSWRPEVSGGASTWVIASIGEVGRGADDFTLHVGTPRGIVARQADAGRVTTQGCLVVSEWSWPDIERAVATLVERCDLGSFRMSAEELQKYCYYEYQDYNERPEHKRLVPVVRSFSSDEVHLSSWDPTEPDNACVAVQMSIGIPRQPQTEVFSVTVATPVGLRAARSGFVLSERATLLLPSYGWESARAHLEEIVGRCRGADWAECRDKLMRSFVSERE